MSSPDEVYLGIWNNLTNNRLLASTLTLTMRDSGLLLSFLTLFLSLTGHRLWKWCSYFVFRLRSRAPTDQTLSAEHLLFARLQAVLRNSNTASNGLVGFVDSARLASTAVTRTRMFRMCAPLILFAGLFVAWIGIASVIPSRFISTGSDVLLRPHSCGVWPEFPTNVTNYGDAVSEAIQYIGAWTGQRVQNMADSSHLNRYCYGATGTKASKHCNSPGRQFVDWTFKTTDTCPFGNISCLSIRSLILDSGFVDSHTDLGINTRKENRIAFRKTLECAVPDLKDYTAVFDRNNVTAVAGTPYYHMSRPGTTLGASGNATSAYLESVSNSTLWQALLLGESYLDNTNATFLWNSQRSIATYSGLVSGNGPAYTIQTAYYTPSQNKTQIRSQASALANANTLSRTFDPIPAFRRDNASTVLVFLMNNMIYSGNVEDPWFGPTSPVNGTVFGDDMTAYLADRPVSTIACFEYAEICNTGESSRPCAPVDMYGASLQGDLTTELGLNRQQISIATRLSAALQKSSLSTAVRELNGGSLRATAKSFAYGSNPVAKDQWILEMQSWFSTVLITTQFAIRQVTLPRVELFFHTSLADRPSRQFVTGYENPQYNDFVTSAIGDDAWMCQAQITRSSDYASFNVLYLVLILVIGGFVIVGSYVVPCLMDWLHGPPKDQFQPTRWPSMDVLSLVEQARIYCGQDGWALRDVAPGPRGAEQRSALLSTGASRPEESQ